MSPGNQLEGLCAVWRRLAQAEGEAIRGGNWAFLADCQQALRQLQLRLSPLLAQARTSWRGAKPQPAGSEWELRKLLSELLQAEEQNLALFKHHRDELETKKRELEGSRRKLRLIRKFCTPAGPPGWSSAS